MNEKEFRQIAQEELSKQIMENLNSGIIFKYINTLEERNKDLEQIEKEHKEENGRLREEVKKYKTMIINHKKQLSKSGIYGYDYDLKILEESD